MQFSLYESKLKNLIAQNSLLKFCIVLLTIGEFFLGYKIDLAMKYQRTILMPNRIVKKTVITGDEVPQDIINQHTRDICTLAFNYNPDSVRGQYGELLQYFKSGDVFEAARTQFYSLADTIKSARLSSSFIIGKPIEIDSDKRLITVTGSERHWVDMAFVDVTEKAYVIAYEVNDGMFQITSISEKTKQQPTGTNSTAAPQPGDRNAK
ncbi:hypothetical protein FO488_00375 [Geobacter sp. FeAm09]|uniref:TraE/TraK family type IV conjugative transfer system protein n=1 Tax=Geobacter sp. FeAm09 TaxID=2597769 RepID=UPI0011EBAD59|nr:TraE/TraK family type IV conjugative transfer system protein [Geobacter sp. FeAm09]QEM66762.1 hypothetical protein FO488_00375 [Geobacter sp. FeAm09]